MRPTTNNIFHTSLAVHPSSLTARRGSVRVGNRRVASQWCTTIASRYGTIGMEAFLWLVVSPELWRIP